MSCLQKVNRNTQNRCHKQITFLFKVVILQDSLNHVFLMYNRWNNGYNNVQSFNNYIIYPF